LIWNILEVYLDDIIVYGRTEDEFVERLEQLLLRLKERRITLNPKKSRLGMSSIEYVGHIIDSTGLTYSLEKVKKVLDFAPPKLAKDLRSFIGLASYFSDKVENMQLALGPLRASTILRWTEEGRAQFALIKDMINNHQKIFFHDVEHGQVFVFTDASDYGIGGYVCQRDSMGREYPVGYLSEVLNTTQRGWSTYEKECYAIVRTFEKFEYLLRDIPFLLMTDHKNLTYLNVPKSTKVLHWKLAIQEYDFYLSHVAGIINVVADCFSRLLSDEEMDGLNDIPKICIMTGEQLPPDKCIRIRTYST
jgi:hypothetical protein